MKTELKAKFLQHLLNKKKNDEGFTLIELLVVIIIIGILAAIALPSFLNQANRARQSEAASYVGSINRGQQAYYLTNDSFAPNLSTLELGISDSKYYAYSTGGATLDSEATTLAAVNTGSAKPFSGIVWTAATAEGTTTRARVCKETATPSSTCTVP